MKKTVASILLLVLVLSLTLGMCSAQAEAWPNGKNIELVLGSKAGGDTDAQFRRIVPYLEKALGTTIAVVNMPGASSTLAGQHVHDAAADGYTMMGLNPESFAPYYFGISDYNSSDYQIAGIFAMDDTLIFCTRKDSPYPTLESLVEAAKANPGTIELPAMQPGGYSYMSAMLFQNSLGVQFNLTDIASNGEKITQLLGGHLDVIGNQYWFVEDYIESGDFVPYCLLAEERNPKFPDVPTLKELGYNCGITCVPKYFYFAFPKGTSEEIVKTFEEALASVMQDEAFLAELDAAMTTPLYMTAAEATEYIKDQEINVYKPLAEAGGF